MSYPEGANVFQKFLGLEGPVDNPVTMLALTPELLSEGGIVKALQARLTQVAEHPEGMSPEADEVRLALHAAAARLLDPSARRQARSAADDPASTVPASSQPTELEAAILLTLATMGGWNKHSLERIGALAQAFGVPVEQVVGLAESLVARQLPPAAGGAMAGGLGGAAPSSMDRPVVAGRRSDDMPREMDPGTRIVRNLVIGGGVALLGTAALIVLSVTLMHGGNSDQGAGEAGPASDPVASKTPEPELFPTRPREEKSKPVQPVKATRIGDWDDLLRDASEATATLESDPQAALTQLEKAYDQMSRKWTEASGDGLVAGVDRLIEFLYRAGSTPRVAEEAVGVIAQRAAPLGATGALDAQQVRASAWSAGVLARVGRERDLPSGVRSRVQEALSHAFPGATGPGESSFKSGCISALSVMATRIMASGPVSSEQQIKAALESWKAWLDGVSAVGGRDTPLSTRLTLLALDALLRSGDDPAQNRAVFESIGLLTTSVSWRKDDESRRWLLRWFESPTVASSDLFALTGALAHKSGAEGVDTSMVLSAGADESARAEMRDRYAAVWGLGAGESRDALMQRWIDAAGSEVDAWQPKAEPVEVVEQVLQMARFNRAASQLWAGELGEIADLLTPITRSGVAPSQMTRSKREAINPTYSTSDWVVRYLAAGHNIASRRELLGQVSSGPDAPMAEVLVEEACRGSPAQVREDARMILIRFGAEPSVLNALLEFAPMIPMTRENSQFVENVTFATLPPVRDPTWRVAVRRAVLERLTQVMAGKSDLARIDGVCDELAKGYAIAESQQAETPVSPETTPVAVDGPALDLAVVQQRLRWQKEAELLVASNREPLSLLQIDQLRRARMELASGRVQEFQVELLSTCELMAFVCVAERPERSSEASRILAEMGEERRSAKHVFEQLRAIERARMKLWMLRFPEKKA